MLKRIKERILRGAIEKRIKNNPFDEVYAEGFTLPQDADPSQNNSFYFSGHALDGTSILFRQAYRGGGFSELWFAYKNKEGDAWVNVRQEFDTTENGLTVKCVEPAKRWEFAFQGELSRTALDESRTAKPTGIMDKVVMNGTFTATKPIFEFSRHFSAIPVARALAKEKLTKNFSKNLAAAFQVHYEQSGYMDIDMEIGGKKIKIAGIPTVRDHSYGTRDWSFMDRHVWNVCLLEDGSELNFNTVRYPIVKELQTGYLLRGDERISTNYYTSMDDYEKNGLSPLSYNAFVVLMNGERLEIKAEKEMQFEFSFCDNAYRFYEGIATFDVNGKRARGITEFGYNKDESRWNR